MRITKVYRPIALYNLIKFVDKNSVIDTNFTVDQKLCKIIFDDLAPDPIIYKPTKWQKIKRHIKAIFNSGLSE